MNTRPHFCGLFFYLENIFIDLRVDPICDAGIIRFIPASHYFRKAALCWT
jgi:hypothetical protein